MQYSSIAQIDLTRLKGNLKRLMSKRDPASPCVVMVKGNAYGHGLVEVAKFLKNDASYFGVASVSEGIALRSVGVQQKIIVFSGFFSRNQVEEMMQYQLIPVIHSFYQIRILRPYLKQGSVEVWLKLNTGMNRLGLNREGFDRAYRHLQEHYAGLKLSALTHLVESEVDDKRFTQKQCRLFEQAIEGKIFQYSSVANSAAVLNHAIQSCHIPRLGISIYGISTLGKPYRDCLGLESVMTLRSQVIAVHQLEVGEGVGYNHKFVARRLTKVAVIPLGYADGYPQYAPEGTPVLVKGQKCSLVGKVSMDTLIVDVTDFDVVKPLDSVVLWGEGLPVEEVADYIGLSPYALVAGLTERVKRDYIY